MEIALIEIVFDEARKVQQVFTWVGRERCTINEVCRRLHQAGVRTQTGKELWDHKTIWDKLKNPAYKGEATFGKTRWSPLVHVCEHHEADQPNRDEDTPQKMLAIRRMDQNRCACAGRSRLV